MSSQEKVSVEVGVGAPTVVVVMMLLAYRFLDDLVGPPPAKPPVMVLKSPRIGISCGSPIYFWRFGRSFSVSRLSELTYLWIIPLRARLAN